jgi:aminodeoxyfutalosine synthase
MIGKETARFALHFGADDLDGTIHETTKIYTLAGSEEQAPVMSPTEISDIIINERFVPVERDSMYNAIK